MSFPDFFSDPEDPASTAAYPRGLALDLVLEVGTLKEIIDSYGISPEQFSRILANPTFRREYEAHQESMQTEGWSFRKKCQAQAELYLNLIFRLVSSDTTPAAIRSELIRSTVKWAGLESPAVQNSNPVAMMGEMAKAVQVMSDDELELRVTQLVLRRTPKESLTPTLTPIPQGVTYDA